MEEGSEIPKLRSRSSRVVGLPQMGGPRGDALELLDRRAWEGRRFVVLLPLGTAHLIMPHAFVGFVVREML
jgi:hypothetical protein